MKILIMSDTHFSRNFSVDNNLLKQISESDMIIHCGDFTSREFFDFLNSSKKLSAVRGNNDSRMSELLGTELKMQLDGFRIAVTHGHYTSIENLHNKYSDSDIIIFGHTHHPSIENVRDQLLINPGSLTANRYVDYNTFMTMNLIEGQKPVVNIFKNGVKEAIHV